jgi:hypothetical protein
VISQSAFCNPQSKIASLCVLGDLCGSCKSFHAEIDQLLNSNPSRDDLYLDSSHKFRISASAACFSGAVASPEIG